MSFVSMYSELTGWVPKLPVTLAKTIINRAWRDVRRKNLWGFQLGEANWVSPALINAGTVTTTTGANTVVFDATATIALSPLLLSGPFPTNLLQRQFRVGISTIYNLTAGTINGSGFLVLTLDRPYTDASLSGQSYSVLQCYYPAPVKDFLMWINVRDITNFNDLVLEKTRYEIDLRDPQRTIFYIPTHVVAYQTDPNPASPTFQYPMFELWGQPQSILPYQLYFIRRGAELVNDSDVLPPAVGEDCVLELGKFYAYQWAEGNKGDMPRNVGSDFKFLMGECMANYKRLFAEYRKDDLEFVNNWFDTIRHRSWYMANLNLYYSAIGQIASPGAAW